jgi:hypothetical protein
MSTNSLRESALSCNSGVHYIFFPTRVDGQRAVRNALLENGPGPCYSSIVNGEYICLHNYSKTRVLRKMVMQKCVLEPHHMMQSRSQVDRGGSDPIHPISILRNTNLGTHTTTSHHVGHRSHGTDGAQIVCPCSFMPLFDQKRAFDSPRQGGGNLDFREDGSCRHLLANRVK